MRLADAIRLTAGLLLVAGTATSQQMFSTLTSSHFTVRYQSLIHEEDARDLLAFLEEEHAAMLDQLGFQDKRTLEVRVYNSVGTFLTETGLRRPWRGALYARGALHIQPLEALRAREILRESIVYELVAFILEPAESRGCPSWLRETYAVHRSGVAQKTDLPPGIRLQSFADLAQDLQDYQQPPQRDDVQAVLDRTMHFFLERYGDSAYAMFRGFDGRKPLSAVVSEVLGERLPDVEKAWARAVRTPAPDRRRR